MRGTRAIVEKARAHAGPQKPSRACPMKIEWGCEIKKEGCDPAILQSSSGFSPVLDIGQSRGARSNRAISALKKAVCAAGFEFSGVIVASWFTQRGRMVWSFGFFYVLVSLVGLASYWDWTDLGHSSVRFDEWMEELLAGTDFDFRCVLMCWIFEYKECLYFIILPKILYSMVKHKHV